MASSPPLGLCDFRLAIILLALYSTLESNALPSITISLLYILSLVKTCNTSSRSYAYLKTGNSTCLLLPSLLATLSRSYRHSVDIFLFRYTEIFYTIQTWVLLYTNMSVLSCKKPTDIKSNLCSSRYTATFRMLSISQNIFLPSQFGVLYWHSCIAFPQT